MGSFNKIAIASAILIFSALLLWPFLNQKANVTPETSGFFTEQLLGDGKESILPIPQSLDLDARKVVLGELLFSDPRLSTTGFSCKTCHDLESSGADGLKVSRTSNQSDDLKNTPTIFNSGFNSLQHWNAEFETLEDQLHASLHNPLHMNNSWSNLVETLKEDINYVQTFQSIYSSTIDQHNITDAIVTFERSLITPNADFDRYLNGDPDALTQQQKKGYQLFNDYGCITCHQGINIGGNLFTKLGIFEHHEAHNKTLSKYDYGRYLYTSDKNDLFVFRVPSLRNVAVTAPYFHDGQAETLYEAIEHMGHEQLDIQLSVEDIEFIENFLNSLTGEYRGRKL